MHKHSPSSLLIIHGIFSDSLIRNQPEQSNMFRTNPYSGRHLARLWSDLSTYFASQTEAKIDQFTTELQNLKKGAPALNEYLLKVRSLIDKLNSIGHKTSPKEHIAAIFCGLPSPDYDTFVISVNSGVEPLDVTALEALLLAQEHRIERKNRDLDSASVNLANSNSRSRSNSG
uniref:Retrotransposon gag domain-containing protein n=1 Tax=Cannabis sativa TaxID=3483 RepID=A0A803QCL1_CANSA